MWLTDIKINSFFGRSNFYFNFCCCASQLETSLPNQVLGSTITYWNRENLKKSLKYVETNGQLDVTNGHIKPYLYRYGTASSIWKGNLTFNEPNRNDTVVLIITPRRFFFFNQTLISHITKIMGLDQWSGVVTNPGQSVYFEPWPVCFYFEHWPICFISNPGQSVLWVILLKMYIWVCRISFCCKYLRYYIHFFAGLWYKDFYANSFFFGADGL